MKPMEVKESFRVANVHQWLRSKYGSANKCEHYACMGESKHYDWSLIDGKKHEKNRNNYRMFCRSCHFKYDWKNGRFDSQKKILPRYGVLNGSRNGKVMCKFNQEEISNIRALVNMGYKSQKEVSMIYRVHPSTISLIITGKTYAKAE